MFKNLQSDALKQTNPNGLSILHDGQEYDRISTQFAMKSDALIKLHDIARSLPPNEASQIRAIADTLASRLKDFRAYFVHSNHAYLSKNPKSE